MSTPDVVQKRLLAFLWVYEFLVISVCAYTGLQIATASGGTPAMAAPLLLISAAEMLRVPLAGWASRLSLGNRLLALVVLACLAVASAEGLILAFDQLVTARAAGVLKAQAAVDDANAALAAEQQKAAPIREAIAAGQHDVEALDAKTATLASSAPVSPGFSGTTCRNSKGAVIGCPADSAAQRTYASARAAHAQQLNAVETARKQAVDALSAAKARMMALDIAGPSAAVEKARHDLQAVAETSPMHRVAASWFGVRAGDLSPEQFAVCRKYAVTTLAVALATLSGLVSWLAHQTPVSDRESRLSRSLRALIARRRKQIVAVRVVPGPERVVEKIIEKIVEVPVEQIRLRYVPVDWKNGRIVHGEEREIVAGDRNPLLRAVQGGK